MSGHTKFRQGKENILYTWFEPLQKYCYAHTIKCDMCGEIFSVNKGFFLAEGVIACYKHMKKEWLEKMGFDVRDK